MKVSQLIKSCAYIFFIGKTIGDVFEISINTSYLKTGELLGIESLFGILWAVFIAFMFSLLIYGFGEIVECYEKYHMIYSDDLTK